MKDKEKWFEKRKRKGKGKAAAKGKAFDKKKRTFGKGKTSNKEEDKAAAAKVKEKEQVVAKKEEKQFHKIKRKALDILFEDNHLIAVNKPAGVLVHADETGDVSLDVLVKKYIKKKFNKSGDVFLGVIHRIDRPVSGVVVFARTSKALTRMTKLFASRDVKKEYWAISYQRPDPNEGKLVHYLIKDKEKNRVNLFDKQRYKEAKRCELNYELISEVGDHYLIKVNPITGRSHQIRAQLSRIGCSIRGDKKYGSTYNQRDGMIHLHSKSLSFIHPVKNEPITITGYPPKEQIWNMFKHFLK